jgi:hypothetical protein
VRYSTNCRAMGRRSLEATKVRFSRWARVAVTFLRGRWLELAVVDFLCVEVLALCAVAAFWLGVLDDDCFVVGVEVLSCASAAQLSWTCRKARMIAKNRLLILTLSSVTRFLASGFV